MLVRNKRKKYLPSLNSAKNPLRADPTRTTTLRLKATRAVRRKFALLKGLIVKLVVGEDAFGLQVRSDPLGLVRNAFCPTGPGGGIDPSCSPGGASFADYTKSLREGRVSESTTFEEFKVIDLVTKMSESRGGFAVPLDEFRSRLGSGQSKPEVDALLMKMRWEGKIRVIAIGDPEGWDRPGRWSSTIQGEGETFGYVEPVRNVENCNPGQMREVGGKFVANRFRFYSSPQKIEEFQRWLRQQFKSVLLGKSDEELWKEFARQGYEKGIKRSFDDVNRKIRWAPGQGDFYEGSRRQFLQSAFGRPESVDKLKLLASRSFTDLVNVTEDMATRMSRTLMDGLARGANPRDLVDQLVEDLDVSEARAETIARTEIIRAHAEGQLDAMEQMGVTEVGVAVEWSTAGDLRVCPKCKPLEGVVLTVQEAHGLIPNHPNCRCSFIPANVGESTKGQKRSEAEILDAFAEADVDPPELEETRPEPFIEPTKNTFCPTGPGGGVDPSCSPAGGKLKEVVVTGMLRGKRTKFTVVADVNDYPSIVRAAQKQAGRYLFHVLEFSPKEPPEPTKNEFTSLESLVDFWNYR